MDSLLSIGALATVERGSRPATIDLRMDLFARVALNDLLCQANVAQVGRGVVYSHGAIIDTKSGVQVGSGSATVAMAPPTDSGIGDTDAGEAEAREASELCEWLDLEMDDDGIASVPYRVGLGGAAGYPFWHGGALTAAMLAAATARANREAPGLRLATATASFDLFAVDAPVILDTKEWRATRTRLSVYVPCAQDGRGVTSRLAAHFIKDR